MNTQPLSGVPPEPPERKGRSRFRRVAGAVLLSASIGLVGMGTSSLFNASESNTADSFTSGTVTVGLGSTGTTCSVTELAPGDSSAGYGTGSGTRTACTYNVKYTGSLPAYLGVDVAVTNGSPSLFTGLSSGLQLKIGASGGVSVIDGTTYKNTSGASTTVAAGTPVTNILLKSTPAVTNDSLTFTVEYLLPFAAPNSLQAGSSTVQLTFHAVQSANQTTSCVAGNQCATIVWS